MENSLYIQTEDIMEKIWTKFSFFMNEVQVKELLYRRYVHSDLLEQDARRLAFENTQKFIYFLKQGVAYFRVAEQSEMIVKPLLQYYGMTSLMKAVILMHDPLYPRTTTVLQHGITTRKKKKAEYVLALDEIKIQKDGLLPLFAQVVLKDQLPIHQKFHVKELLSIVPEFQDAYKLIFNELSLIPISISKTDSHTNAYTIQFKHLESTNKKDVLAKCQTIIESVESLSVNKVDLNNLTLHLKSSNITHIKQHKFIRQDLQGKLFFFIGEKVLYDDIIIMNMLSYFFSMLCRYDTELWGEILFSFSSSDLYLITEYLNISLRKFPNLILNHFFNTQIIFTRT